MLEFSECNEYVRGDEFHPMHTDPLCINCGGPRKDHR